MGTYQQVITVCLLQGMAPYCPLLTNDLLTSVVDVSF